MFFSENVKSGHEIDRESHCSPLTTVGLARPCRFRSPFRLTHPTQGLFTMQAISFKLNTALNIDTPYEI